MPLPRLDRHAAGRMNQVVQVEPIDLGGIELGEPGADVLEQCSQLALVIGDNQLPRGRTMGLIPGTTLRVAGPDHGRTLRPPHRPMHVARTLDPLGADG